MSRTSVRIVITYVKSRVYVTVVREIVHVQGAPSNILYSSHSPIILCSRVKVDGVRIRSGIHISVRRCVIYGRADIRW